MRKQEFLAQLRKALSGLPQDEIEERLTFYGEMIDEKISYVGINKNQMFHNVLYN